jgi:hypothetical protein
VTEICTTTLPENSDADRLAIAKFADVDKLTFLQFREGVKSVADAWKHPLCGVIDMLTKTDVL